VVKPHTFDGVYTDDRGRSDRRIQRRRRITLTLSKADAEVLLGVLASERLNAEAEAVCDALRAQLDQKLAEAG